MRKVIKFVTGKKDEKQEDSGVTSIQSKELNFSVNLEKGKLVDMDNTSDYIVNYFERDKSWTKLHKAAWLGNLEKLKSALKKTEINAVDSRQRTALHFAVVQGHPNIVWFLLENNAKTTIYDSEGHTPLLKAIEFGHKECILLLLERGADINEADYKGNTGLHIAVRKSSVDLVTTILKKGANTELSNKDGEYVLHITIKLENEELLNLLLNNKARVDVLDRFNRTPLMLAAKAGNLILVNILIEFGAQLMLTDSQGKTAEDYASLAGHKEIAMLLKTLFEKKNKHLESKKDNNKLKINSSDESFLKGIENIRTSGKYQSESNEVKSFLMAKSKETDKIENETYEKNHTPESPDSYFLPPFCPSPQSWNFMQADTTNRIPKTTEFEISAGNENSQSDFLARKKFNNELKLSQKYTLSLDRRKKVNNFFVKRRFSFAGEEALKRVVKKRKIFKTDPHKAKIDTRMLFKIANRPLPQTFSEDVKFTIGGQFYENATISSVNNKKCNSDSSTIYAFIDYDEISNSKNTGSTCEKISSLNSFPSEALGEAETSSTLTQALQYNTEITENISGNSVVKRSSTITSTDNESVYCLPERNFEKILKMKVFQNGKAKKAVFSQTFENRGQEILEEETKKKRLLEIKKKINKQLDCYDEALKELAKSNPTKRDSDFYKYQSFPSSKIRFKHENPDTEFKTLNNRKTLSFPFFGKQTFASLSNSKNILLNEEKRSLKSSSGESWDSLLVDLPFWSLERTVKEKKSKSVDFSPENEPLSCFEDRPRKEEVRLNDKTYDSDEDISEISEEQTKNMENTVPFSPLGVIFKEIQKDNDLISSPRSPEFDSRAENRDTVKIQNQVLQNPNSKNRFFNGEEYEANQEFIQSQTSDISLSSGSVELLGLEKDSGSEPESSHKEITPLHDFSFKIQQDLLKFNLKITTTEKIHLEELIAKMSEKSERLQYELADAKEITRMRDEVIKLLQHQLERMEAAYTKSLEESIHNKLQLTSNEQEILHLKKMCYKYEEEKTKSANEADYKNMENLILKIKKLVSEKEKLKEEIVQLEKEKLSLVNYLKDYKETKAEHQCQGWKERFPFIFKEEQIDNNEKKYIASVSDPIQKLKETKNKKDETIFMLNAANLEDLSRIEMLALKSNFKTKSTNRYIRKLRKSNFTYANCQEIKGKQNAEYFPKESQLLKHKCRLEKNLLNDASAKNRVFFRSQNDHEKIVKESKKN